MSTTAVQFATSAGLVEYAIADGDVSQVAPEHLAQVLEQLAAAEPAAVDDEPYAGWSLADLKAELAARNADRPDDDQLVPLGAKKADVLAALVADDAAADSTDETATP